MRLKDQVAIVTGGGGRIGEGICLCLAKEGAHVVVSDISQEAAVEVARRVEEHGRKTLAIKTDVRFKRECELMVDKALEVMDRIDILVCCSGVGGFFHQGASGESAALEDISEDHWNRTIDINLKGVFFCNQAIAPHFKRYKRGKIINISSTAGRRGVDILPHYCASKAGVIVLTQSVALHLAPFNVTANTICPGKIWTPMWEIGARVMSHNYPQFQGKNPKEIFDAMIEATVPLKRPQRPEDIGKAVVFIASSDADQITGQALNVDGGSVFN